MWRAEIVLFTAEGLGTNEIMRRTGKAKTSIWRWQERFMEEGFDGLLRDKTRPSRIPPLGADVAKRVVALTLTNPPGETTHWTGVMMAKASGISVSAVQRIWRAHGLRPPKFVDKLRDVVKQRMMALIHETFFAGPAMRCASCSEDGILCDHGGRLAIVSTVNKATTVNIAFPPERVIESASPAVDARTPEPIAQGSR